MVVDFNGFKDMVDAVGGVPVCIPEDIEDPAHGINIPAGEREIRGDEALDYVRVRYTVGNQSDLGRIKRQQTFMAAMIKKVASAETLARPDRLVKFLNAATKSLTLDFESVGDLAGLGLQLQDIGLDKVAVRHRAVGVRPRTTTCSGSPRPSSSGRRSRPTSP